LPLTCAISVIEAGGAIVAVLELTPCQLTNIAPLVTGVIAVVARLALVVVVLFVVDVTSSGVVVSTPLNAAQTRPAATDADIVQLYVVGSPVCQTL
jgi:hypothetical protein